MWPYAARRRTSRRHDGQDHAALVAIGRRWRRANGYRPEQGSDLYVASGHARLPLRHVPGLRVHRRDVGQWTTRRRRDRARDGAQQGGRPLAAERAWCPLAVLGAAVRVRAAGRSTTTSRSHAGGRSTPTAPTRRPRRAASPAATRGTRLQRRQVPAVGRALRASRFVTGPAAGARRRRTTSTGARRFARRTSPSRQRPASAMDSGSSSATRRTRRRRTTCGRSSKDGGPDVLLAARAPPPSPRASGQTASGSLDAWAGHTIRIRFEALDGGPALDGRGGPRRPQGHAPAGLRRRDGRAARHRRPPRARARRASSPRRRACRDRPREPLRRRPASARIVPAGRLQLAPPGDQPPASWTTESAPRSESSGRSPTCARRASSRARARSTSVAVDDQRVERLATGRGRGPRLAGSGGLEQALDARAGHATRRCDSRLRDRADVDVVGRVAHELDRPPAEPRRRWLG